MTETNPKGRILGVKHGFNPNSSSMGSIIFALPVALMATTVGFTAVSSLILNFFIKAPPHPAETGEQSGGVENGREKQTA